MIDNHVRLNLPENSKVFDNPSFDNSIIGVTTDDRVVYSYNLMVGEFIDDNNCDLDEAIEFIDYNTLRALPYFGEDGPIVMYSC